MAERTGWQRDLEAELRELGSRLDVPQAPDLTNAVRKRLDHPDVRPARPPRPRLHRPAWQLALVVLVVLLSLLVATPQGRAVITHVFRFSGIELSEEPSRSGSPRASASLPGEHRVSLEQARREVAFTIAVPTMLGRPDEVVVSDGGRVATLVYHDTPHGEIRMDQFDGHLDPVYFKKVVYADDVTATRVGDHDALWINGPHELSYVRRDGTSETATARLTKGNTLIWGTERVALRLEGSLDKGQALAVARSTR